MKTSRPHRAFVDTNVFLRILTADDAAQAKAAVGLLRAASRGEVELVANAVVMAEIVWTLARAYRLTPSEIRRRVEAILNTPGVTFEDADILLEAIDLYERTGVNYADAYHAAWALTRQVPTAYTFDTRHFSRLGFDLVINPSAP